MTVTAAHRQSILNAMTLVAAEQQTMNYYMTAGNRPTDPLARGVYLEIAQIEEQHVSHYESCLDPTMSWLTNWVLHENHECWMYWSFLQTEVDPRIRQIWETHLAMEIEHLRIAAQALEQIEGRDVTELLGAGFEAPMVFEENKAYLKEVVASQVDLTAWVAVFTPVSELPEGHRYFAYQAEVNAGGTPTEQVIERHRAEFGREYRHETGEHPVPSLQEEGPHEELGYWRAARMHGAQPAADV
jgi:rubrerythrin